MELPLTMPENYDFSHKKVDWKSYKNDYILRTDAVWEKSKLYAYFYSVYKAVIIDKIRKKFTGTRETIMTFLSNTYGNDSKMKILNGIFMKK